LALRLWVPLALRVPLAVGVACFVGAGVWVAAGVGLGPELVMSLRMDPRTPVMGSVAGWRPPETPDASPESNDGRLSVAA
jgi:hypothetical protein